MIQNFRLNEQVQSPDCNHFLAMAASLKTPFYMFYYTSLSETCSPYSLIQWQKVKVYNYIWIWKNTDIMSE